MKRALWISCAAVLAATLASAEPTTKVERKIVLRGEGEPLTLQLDDLADGETRTFQQEGRTVQVTRQGEELKVLIDGKEVDGPRKQIVIRQTGSPEGAAGAEGEKGERKRVMIWHSDGDKAVGGDPEELRKHLEEAGVSADRIEVLVGAQGRVVFRCPDDGTELIVKKELAGDADAKGASPYLCPLDNRPMERVEAPEHAFGYSFETKDEPAKSE